MNDSIQTGAAMAAIGMLGTVVGLIVGYLKDRDKLRFDVDMTAVKAQNAGQAAQIAALTASQRECLEAHEKCQEQHHTVELRLKDIEAAVATVATAKK